MKMKEQTKKIVTGLIILSFFVVVSLMARNNNYVEKANTDITESNDIAMESNDVKIDSKVEDLKNTNTILFTPGENKIIEYGKIFIEFSDHYIISCTENKDSAEYKLKSDNISAYSDEEITLKITESNKSSFESTENMVAYANEVYTAYDNLKVFYNLIDDYGVTAYYQVEKNGEAYYLVFYTDKAYEIESTSSLIGTEVTSSFHEPSYEQVNEDILSENVVLANVKREYSFFENRAKIEIIQSESKGKITVEIGTVEYEHTIEVKNSDGKVLVSSQLYGDNFYRSFVQVLDLNGDGYVDLQILKTQGTRNNEYDLYIYNEDMNEFTKIDIGNNLLSNIEIRDGYIYNWINDSPDIGEGEYFLIEGDKLVKKDEVNH